MSKVTLLLSLAVIALTGCTTPTTQTHAGGAHEEKIASLQKEADSGSFLAAYRIFLVSAQRDALAMKYLRLAADRYVPAMSALGAILLESQDPADRAEGERFLRMAALHGDVDAKKFLELRGIAW